MKAKRITEDLIGKRFEGQIEGVSVQGTIDSVGTDRISKEGYIHIHFDKPTNFWVADGGESEIDPMQTGGHYYPYKGAAVYEKELDFSAIH